jgi:3',5'-cyclic-AMP phosphodiesterase
MMSLYQPMNRVYCVVFLLIALLGGCSDMTEYSPNQVSDNNSPSDLNAVNLRRIAATVPSDTVTVVFVGDSQRFYDEVDGFVQKVNQFSNIDFVILAGDITDFGLLQEYEWIASRLKKLNAPYIAVIGNHDVIANGEEVYKKMFGPLDFSFVYDSIQFIVHNTNGREYRNRNVPDIGWLKQELTPKPAVKHIVAVSHVPPFDGDFDQSLVAPYHNLFAEQDNFLVSLHGHIHDHKDGYLLGDGVRYLTSHSFDQRQFILLKIFKGQVHKMIVDY